MFRYFFISSSLNDLYEYLNKNINTIYSNEDFTIVYLSERLTIVDNTNPEEPVYSSPSGNFYVNIYTLNEILWKESINVIQKTPDIPWSDIN